MVTAGFLESLIKGCGRKRVWEENNDDSFGEREDTGAKFIKTTTTPRASRYHSPNVSPSFSTPIITTQLPSPEVLLEPENITADLPYTQFLPIPDTRDYVPFGANQGTSHSLQHLTQQQSTPSRTTPSTTDQDRIAVDQQNVRTVPYAQPMPVSDFTGHLPLELDQTLSHSLQHLLEQQSTLSPITPGAAGQTQVFAMPDLDCSSFSDTENMIIPRPTPHLKETEYYKEVDGFKDVTKNDCNVCMGMVSECHSAQYLLLICPDCIECLLPQFSDKKHRPYINECTGIR